MTSARPPLPAASVRRTRWALIGAGCVGLAGLGLFLTAHALERAARLPTAPRIEQDRALLPKFLRARDALATKPFFKAQRPTADAGPWLNARLVFSSPRSVKRFAPQAEGLELPDDILAAAAVDQPGFPANYDPVDVSTLDFSWMKSLQQYGAWDTIVASPRLKTHPFDALTSVEPEMERLVHWGELRLVHGLRTGALPEAARDAEHLAWLCYASELFQGVLYANLLLTRIGQAEQKAGLTPSWTSEDLHRLRCVFAGSIHYSSVFTPQDLMASALGSVLHTAGLCAAINRTIPIALAWRPLLEPLLSFEYLRLDKMLEVQSGCRLNEARLAAKYLGEERDGYGFLDIRQKAAAVAQDEGSDWLKWGVVPEQREALEQIVALTQTPNFADACR